MSIGFWWGSQKERDHQEDIDAGGRVILKYMIERYDRGGMGWIDLTQDRDQWRALLNTVTNLRVP
jgi:hypothetical protein